MNKSPLDAGIPVLTEIIAPPPEIEAPEASPSAAPVELAQPAPMRAELDELQWRQLEREVTARVLERVDSMLEQRVRDSLADVLQLAVDRLAEEIRGSLHQGIREVVAAAVAQELADMQSSKK